LKTVEQMLDRHFNVPPTSSAGRLFDAVAALCGVRDRVSYEGQAAVELEWLATTVLADGIYPFDLTTTVGEPPSVAAGELIIDTRPLIGAVAAEVNRGVAAAAIARLFHSTLVEMVAQVCGRLRDSSGLNVVVLSGGVFLNALLTAEVNTRLRSDGFCVYRHHLVPPGDGGLSLGQLAIAARHSQKS
jgi:hydrogenase maturation protein HypF